MFKTRQRFNAAAYARTRADEVKLEHERELGLVTTARADSAGDAAWEKRLKKQVAYHGGAAVYVPHTVPGHAVALDEDIMKATKAWLAAYIKTFDHKDHPEKIDVLRYIAL